MIVVHFYTQNVEVFLEVISVCLGDTVQKIEELLDCRQPYPSCIKRYTVKQVSLLLKLAMFTLIRRIVQLLPLQSSFSSTPYGHPVQEQRRVSGKCRNV